MRRRGLAASAIAGAALLLPGAAQAQAQAGKSIVDIALELAYDYCPRALDNRLAVDAPELKALGFTAPPQQMQHPRVGAIALVGTQRPDGEISFAAGTDSMYCQVNVIGANAAAAFPALRGAMARLGIAFAADPENSGQRGGATVESFRAPNENGSVLHLQFVRTAAGAPTPMTGFQLIVLDQ